MNDFIFNTNTEENLAKRLRKELDMRSKIIEINTKIYLKILKDQYEQKTGKAKREEEA